MDRPEFLSFVLATLVITYFSARKSSGSSSAYFAAGRRITAWQNGLAVAGDYMSAASFLGIAGMIAVAGWLLTQAGLYLWQRGDLRQAHTLLERALATREAHFAGRPGSETRFSSMIFCARVRE